MTNTIDFAEQRMIREVDENCRMLMPDGSTWFKFSAEYDFESSGFGMPEELLLSLDALGAAFVPDGKFTIEFWARNMEEAERRVEAMKATLSDPVQIAAQIPA